MRPVEFTTWKTATRQIAAVIGAGSDYFAAWIQTNRNAALVGTRVKVLRERMAANGKEAWDDEVSRMALDVAGYDPRELEGRAKHVHDPTVVDDGHEDGLPDLSGDLYFDPIALAKAMKLGHAVATRDGSGLTPGERAYVEGLMANPTAELSRVKPMRDGPRAVPRPSRLPTDDLVTFTHVWRRLRPGASRSQEIVTSTASVSVRHVAATEAPVAVRLPTVEDGHLDVRSVDGVLYRPVLAPASWRPVGLAEFAEAALDGRAWADGPFVPRSVAARLLPDLAEYAVPGEPANDAQATAREDARSRALARCGDLIVVDGIVHRTTSAPTVYVEAIVDSRRPADVQATRLGWRLGDGLRMSTPQATLGRAVGRHRPLEVVHGAGYVEASVRHAVSFATFAFAWLNEADEVSKRARKVRPGSEARATWSRRLPGAPIVMRRPDLLPPDPTPFSRILAAWPDHVVTPSGSDRLRASPVLAAARRAVEDGEAGIPVTLPDRFQTQVLDLVRDDPFPRSDVFTRALPRAIADHVHQDAPALEHDPELDGLSL